MADWQFFLLIAIGGSGYGYGWLWCKSTSIYLLILYIVFMVGVMFASWRAGAALSANDPPHERARMHLRVAIRVFFAIGIPIFFILLIALGDGMNKLLN